MNKADMKKIANTKLKYDKSTQFLHCDHCLNEYFKEREANFGESALSPRDAMKYETASYPFKFPDGHSEAIIVVWCSKCGRDVWDSRHLIHRY